MDENEKLQFEADIRLECLKLAILGREGHGPEQIISAAKTMVDYVLRGTDNG